MKKHLTFGFFGVEKIGRPIMVNLMGAIEREKLFEVMPEERVWQYII